MEGAESGSGRPTLHASCTPSRHMVKYLGQYRVLIETIAEKVSISFIAVRRTPHTAFRPCTYVTLSEKQLEALRKLATTA